MSKFTKCVLAGAITLAFASTAPAADIVTTNGSFAHEVTKADTNGNPTATASAVSYKVTAPDILIGRSAITGQVTVSGTITGATLASAPTVSFPAFDTVGGYDPTEDASLQGSVTSGTNSFQFVVLPPSVANGGFAQGNIFTISALSLKNATALSTLGGEVTVSIEVRDTTTGTLLSSATVQPVLTSVQGSATTVAGGSTVIDVMAPSLKTLFVGGDDFTKLGTVGVSRADLDSVTAGIQGASVAGTGAVNNSSGGATAHFQFDDTADQLKLTLSVPSASAFEAFYATQNANCSATVPATGVFAPVMGSTTEFTTTVDIDDVDGVGYSLCAVVKGDTKIDAQTIGLTAQIELDDALTINPPAKVEEAFHVLKYNGSVVNVDHFNPASNSSQISYLRIINPSTASGLVHVEGVCDDGSAQPAVSFELEGGAAVLRTAQQLKAAGFEQCATGKSRLTVTGEFAGMRVQNFLRNVMADGTQINTNVNTNDMNTQGL